MGGNQESIAMISHDLDPTLHTSEPEPQQLDDGFSRPHHAADVQPAPPTDAEPVLPEKSAF